jgi:hypothetical protein
MNEALEKVEHDLGSAFDGLREALYKASTVEALVLFPLLKRVNETRNDVATLFAARTSDTANAPVGQSVSEGGE